MYGQICGNLCPMQQKRKQSKDGLSRNQSSTMPDNWEECSSSNQNDEEFKLTMKAARRKLEVPMPAAMPCKIPIKRAVGKPPQYWETQDKIRLCCWCRRKHETKAGRSRTQTSSRSYHWKGWWILWPTTVLFTNSFPCLKQFKFQMQKQQWRNNGKNWRKSRHGSWRKSEIRKRWSMKQGMRAELCTLRR